jgi:putative endonuclease
MNGRRNDPADGPGDGRRRRRRAHRFGRLAETACALVLRLKGYSILARDFRTPVGEIDIVARRGAVVAFVEVKARSGGDAIDGLGRRQRQRIARAALAFVQQRPALAGLGMRFDVMLIDGRRLPRHIADAWRPEA